MSYFKASGYFEDRGDSQRQKNSGTNIIREEELAQSFHSKKDYGGTFAPVDLNLPFKGTMRMGEIKGRVERELNQQVNLETEKKQLTLLLEDQAEIQSRIKNDYSRQIESSRGLTEQHRRTISELIRELEARQDRLERRMEEWSQTEAELIAMTEENRNLETEIRRLGEKTSGKVAEMQNKLQAGLAELQSQKDRHEKELDHLNQVSADKIRRSEEELSRKAAIAQEKFNEAIETRTATESELIRLQDTKRRGEIELEEKIRSVRQQFYEEDSAQFSSIYRISQNRLRTLIENKEMHLKRYTTLMRELESLSKEMDKSERDILDSNSAMNDEVRSTREESSQVQSEIEQIRTRNMNQDTAIHRIQAEISQSKFAFKQASENNRYRVKELVEKCGMAVRNAQVKISSQIQRNKDYESELNTLVNKFKAIEINSQKIANNMREQLNRNIYSTINEHKEIDSGLTKESLGRSFGRSFV